MKKIPTIFKRNHDNMRGILNESHPDCEWVFDGPEEKDFCKVALGLISGILKGLLTDDFKILYSACEDRM